MNKENIIKTFKGFSPSLDDYLGAMYINIYGELPNNYKIYFDNDKKLQYFNGINDFYDTRINLQNRINERKLLKDLYTNKEKYGLEVFCYSQNEYLICGELENDYLFDPTHFLINITLSEGDDFFGQYINTYTNNIEKTFEFLKGFIEPFDSKNKTEFGIAATDVTGSLYTSWYDYKNKNINIHDNYNDDFETPYNHICELIEREDESSLILLYGDPGTGKTSVIKNLISKYPQKDFIFIDGSLLANIGQDKLMGYFLENNETIFILEDCEKCLVNRDHNYNPIMPVLLNLTDGIIGDVLGIKLICTFNTSLNNIDKALLRKGRLSLKYEFKNLCKEKAEALLKKLNKNTDNIPYNGMPLSDIYYIEEENDYSKKPSKKIGF